MPLMDMSDVRYEKKGGSDKRALFDRVSRGVDGVDVREEVVAFGDGVSAPYRSFIKAEIFELARPYLLSPDSNVTALDAKKLAGLTGAMLARQSRISGSVVDVLVKEFLVTTDAEASELGLAKGEVKAKKLEGIIERILIQYGDDSVQELECATVLFNSVSNLAAKLIEDRRLAGFIEQSSRYVLYTERDPVTGYWLYLREKRIMASAHGAEYVRMMDRLFTMYARLAAELTEHYKTLKPVGEWNSSRLVFRGKHGEHWLNGRQVVDFDLGTQRMDSLLAKSKYRDLKGFATKRAGHIVLQNHVDEVYFRNIKIRVL